MTVLAGADWPVSDRIWVAVTTRHGGVSKGPWRSCNLGDHVEDDPAHVQENRRRLQQRLPGQSPIQWLRQVHGTSVFELAGDETIAPPQADALYTRQQGIALAVLTADCLPLCLASQDGSEIAVVHAGWRGLLAGVIENTLARFTCPLSAIRAWMGPAIGPCHFEVGPEVREAFIEVAAAGTAINTSEAFYPVKQGNKFLADLYRLASLRLMGSGVESISGGGRCTWCEHDDFYSYRRQPETGRFATLIGIRGLGNDQALNEGPEGPFAISS